MSLVFAPDHLINYANVRLNNFDDFSADVFVHIVWHWNAVIVIAVHFHSCIDCLKQTLFVNSTNKEATFIKSLWTFRRCTDTYCRERMSH